MRRIPFEELPLILRDAADITGSYQRCQEDAKSDRRSESRRMGSIYRILDAI